eukprot:31460-Alexandrium_andersonii.AAC.1
MGYAARYCSRVVRMPRRCTAREGLGKQRALHQAGPAIPCPRSINCTVDHPATGAPGSAHPRT